jgi:hypothetical protein
MRAANRFIKRRKRIRTLAKATRKQPIKSVTLLIRLILLTVQAQAARWG